MRTEPDEDEVNYVLIEPRFGGGAMVVVTRGVSPGDDGDPLDDLTVQVTRDFVDYEAAFDALPALWGEAGAKLHAAQLAGGTRSSRTRGVK